MCGVTEYPVTTLGCFRRQGALEEMLDAASCTCISDSECLFGPLVAALFVLLVLSGNVFAARRKPSDCKSILLETHQLYSRLISCTRKISTLHLEFKYVCSSCDVVRSTAVFVCCCNVVRGLSVTMCSCGVVRASNGRRSKNRDLEAGHLSA